MDTTKRFAALISIHGNTLHTYFYKIGEWEWTSEIYTAKRNGIENKTKQNRKEHLMKFTMDRIVWLKTVLHKLKWNEIK